MSEFNLYFAGLLVSIHVLGYELLGLFCALIIAMAPCKDETSKAKMLIANENKNCQPNLRFVKIYELFLYNRLFILICTFLCGFVHRRHLMVWSIFVPKVYFCFKFLQLLNLFLRCCLNCTLPQRRLWLSL